MKKQLINLFGRLYDACVKGVLEYGVVEMNASLHAFLVARCICASINFELARTIVSCLVCLSTDKVRKPTVPLRIHFHLGVTCMSFNCKE